MLKAIPISTIFLDMDGVMADMHTDLVRLFGDDPATYGEEQWAEVAFWGLSVPKENFWERVRSKGVDWWANLPKLPWADALYRECEKAAPTYFLTSPAPFHECLAGKWQWVDRYYNARQLIVSKAKHFCSAPGRVLIEDRISYAKEWEKYGGIFVPLKRAWNKEGYEIEEILDWLRACRRFNEASV